MTSSEYEDILRISSGFISNIVELCGSIIDLDANFGDPLIVIEAYRLAYERDGNPLDAWSALYTARRSDLPIPDWVLTYLDRCATSLLHLAKEGHEGNNKTSPASEIAEAIEMKDRGKSGRGTRLSKFTDKKWMIYGIHVGNRMVCFRDQEKYAIEGVAKKFNVSPSTVRLGWKKYLEAPSTPILLKIYVENKKSRTS